MSAVIWHRLSGDGSDAGHGFIYCHFMDTWNYWANSGDKFNVSPAFRCFLFLNFRLQVLFFLQLRSFLLLRLKHEDLVCCPVAGGVSPEKG